MYQYKFKFDYPKIPLEVGKYHIHCPEHISKYHAIGAPNFKIASVEMPKTSTSVTSIRFQCETLGNQFDVFMSSKNACHSELVFSKVKKNQQMCDVNAFLRLKFEVEGYSNDSHRLIITFGFWNIWLHVLAPLLPFFVVINGLEDWIFLYALSRGVTNLESIVDEDPLLSLYRLYIYCNESEQNINK
jgi:hypothetical protein